LIPDPRRGAVEVLFRGRNCTLTVGTRPHVLLYTATETPLEIRRRIVFEGSKIRSFPGSICAESSIHLQGISSLAIPAGLTVKLAHRMYLQTQAAAEAETAAKTADWAAQNLGEDLKPALTFASQSVGQWLSGFQRDGSLEYLNFRTTAAFLQARLRIASSAGVQPEPPPALPSDVDLGLRLHESLINEVARAKLGEKSFLLNEVQKFYDETTLGLLGDGRADGKDGLKIFEKLLANSGKPPATITLTKNDPLTVVFLDQGFMVEIHVASIRQEDVVYKGMRVRAAYQLENTRAGLLAVRKGPVRFFPSDEPEPVDEKLEAQPAAFLVLREFLFGEIMKERLVFTPPPLPADIAGLRFQAPRSAVSAGWLSLAWKLTGR
jgi:hypothetical protein